MSATRRIGLIFERCRQLVRQLLAKTPDIPATVLAERVGWTGSLAWFRDNVRRVRPEHRPVHPPDRLTRLAGDAAQCDLWFPPKKIRLEDGTMTLLPVPVMTCAPSRFMLAVMIPTRHTEDLLLGMWTLLQELGAVPQAVPGQQTTLWDEGEGGSLEHSRARVRRVPTARCAKMSSVSQSKRSLLPSIGQRLSSPASRSSSLATPDELAGVVLTEKSNHLDTA